MRLTVFGPAYPFRGGIARTTTELVRILAERGHEVVFLTPRRQYPQWLYPGISDRDPEACPRLDCAEAVLDPLDPVSWRIARRRALEYRADAWVIPYWTWAWAGLWWYLLREADRPAALAVVHNPVDHDARLWQRIAARRVFGSSQALFTHARSMAAELEREYPSIPVGWHRLPPAPVGARRRKSEARTALDLPEDRRVALFLGLIRPYKGVDLLLEAAAGLPADSDWLIVVAGEPWGGLGGRLERQADALGLGARVRLDLRWIPEGEVPTLLAAADLVVLPYRRGSQSAVAPMALAEGVPVLSTAVGGVPEVVRDGINGVIVPPGDPTAITAALESLGPERLGELAAGAVRSAGDLSWSDYATALEQLLDQIL
jgi:glycosyltransferase involved in cell wall biosynthesis